MTAGTPTDSVSVGVPALVRDAGGELITLETERERAGDLETGSSPKAANPRLALDLASRRRRG